MAVAMGAHIRTVWRWELGETVIPKVVELALRYIAEHESKIDLEEAKAAMWEARKKGTVSWNKIKKDLMRKHRVKKELAGPKRRKRRYSKGSFQLGEGEKARPLL